MIRREIREKAFMLLFQLEFQKGDEDQQLAGFIEQYEIDPESSEYFNKLVNGVRTHQDDLDNCFIPFLKGWTKERLPKVDLTIMRLAVFEMMYVEEIPDSVAISEAVILTKRFSNEESRAYINAVLGKINRSRKSKTDTQEVIQEEDSNE